MDEQRGNGSDLPKPKKPPKPPEKPGELHRAAQKKPARAEQGRPAARKPKNRNTSAPPVRKQDSRHPYASDTAEIPIPPMEYEDDYSYDDTPGYGDYTAAPAPRKRRTASGHGSRQYTAAPPPRRRKRRSSCLGRILKGILSLFVIVFVLYSVIALLLISRLEKVPSGSRSIFSGQIGTGSNTRSILLIGTDSRDLTQERGRSDSMILLTINDHTQELYLSSLMRDSYVNIPGHGMNKLNAAYSLGGADLLLDTVEQNFNVRIDDYLCVSFAGFAGVIDAFGGVELTLSDSEAQAVNVILQSEVNALMGDDPMADFLNGEGTYKLNGKQALAYARIRYVGNADFERTSRQREVMEKLLEKAKTNAAAAIPELVGSAMPHLSTNMSTAELYVLSLRAPLLVGYDLQQQQIPADGTWSGITMPDGQQALQVNFEANQDILKQSAYAYTKSVGE